MAENRLKYIKGVDERKRRYKQALFQCECGETIVEIIGEVRRGKVKSCGCLKKEAAYNITHGMSNNSEYWTWRSMLARCSNPNNESYSGYGERGINVCRRWLDSFENFYEDMGDKFVGASIDRIDNNKGYSKSNCRWATSKTQARNKRNTIMMEWKDMNLPLVEWAEALEVPSGRIFERLKNGWSIEDALFQPKSTRIIK